MGVDNVIIELDNLELPILDGSALPYVEAFAEVGIRSQRRRRQYLRILKSVEVRENGKFIAVYPGEGYSITYDINFADPIGRQAFTVDLAAGAYGAQIAAARTFGFREDERMLRDMGLIRVPRKRTPSFSAPARYRMARFDLTTNSSPQSARPDW